MACEKAGVPAIVNVCEGFQEQMHVTSDMGGQPWLPVAFYPGHVDNTSVEGLQKEVSELIVPGIVKGITTPLPVSVAKTVPLETTVVFKGTWEEVLTYYREQHWSDGLPIIPPTVERVKEFLKYTDLALDALLTPPMQPSYFQATPWAVAVNGVMAGCRPEYMPILIAMTKAWGLPDFHMADMGSTAGQAPIVILSAPTVQKQLGINYGMGGGVPGLVSNTSIGRFWTMWKRNIVGMRLEAPTDMGAFGFNFTNLRAENGELAHSYGWKTLAEQRGFTYQDNVVHTMNVTQSSSPLINGSTGDEIMKALCASSSIIPSSPSSTYLMFVVSKVVTDNLARDKWDTDKILDYFMKNMMTPAKVPALTDRKALLFVCGGDPDRNRVVTWSGGGPVNLVGAPATQTHGALRSVKIELPKNWDALIKDSQLTKDMAKSGKDIL